MAIESIASSDGNKLTIKAIGRFDFSSLQDFRSAYTNYNDKPMTFRVDFSQTEYMDSAALGMLLVLKEFAEKMGGAVTLYKPTNTIKSILDIARFDTLFNIES
jgi:anti-anti-sigma factor